MGPAGHCRRRLTGARTIPPLTVSDTELEHAAAPA